MLPGIAMKPPRENMSKYCLSSAQTVFAGLIGKLRTKYIIVTYNNTYNAKSSSSINKISLDQILTTLEERGSTEVFEKKYHRFNSGKTGNVEHKEYVFLTKVQSIRRAAFPHRPKGFSAAL